MKQLADSLLNFGLVFSAQGQALPDNPGPAPLSDPAWARLQSLVNGQPIVVDNTNGPPVHCLFAGVTDAFLYCNPPGNPRGRLPLQSRRRARRGFGSAGVQRKHRLALPSTTTTLH